MYPHQKVGGALAKFSQLSVGLVACDILGCGSPEGQGESAGRKCNAYVGEDNGRLIETSAGREAGVHSQK